MSKKTAESRSVDESENHRHLCKSHLKSAQFRIINTKNEHLILPNTHHSNVNGDAVNFSIFSHSGV